MKTEDLLSALSSELEYQMKRQSTRFPRGKLRKLLLWADRIRRVMEHSDTPNDYAGAAVAELFDALEQFAPPYGYFGSLEGDGADYGYWLRSNLVEDFDGLKVDDTSKDPQLSGRNTSRERPWQCNPVRQQRPWQTSRDLGGSVMRHAETHGFRIVARKGGFRIVDTIQSNNWGTMHTLFATAELADDYAWACHTFKIGKSMNG